LESVIYLHVHSGVGVHASRIDYVALSSAAWRRERTDVFLRGFFLAMIVPAISGF
jgi:hypothetical protein